MKKKTETEFLRERLRKAHNFIHAMKRNATGYGSNFSEDIVVDCEAFLSDNPPPKDSTHVVITRAYLNRLRDCAYERLKLRREITALKQRIAQPLRTKT